MKNRIIYLFTILFANYLIYSQSVNLNNVVSGLKFHLNNIQNEITPQDTLDNRILNFHYIKPNYEYSILKVDGDLNKKTVFVVSNKFGDTENIQLGRIGNSIISSLGVFNKKDTLLINSTNVESKILTYSGFQFQNPIIINNLEPLDYKLEFSKQGFLPITRKINLRGSLNQNIDNHYVWEGNPIELDLNYDTFHYELTDSEGIKSTLPPLILNKLGLYKLKITNAKGCENVQNISVLSQEEYNALNEASEFKALKMFPNPSKDGKVQLSVELKTPKSLTVQVFNSLGTLILQKNYNSEKTFNISLNIPPLLGFYNVKVITQKEVKTLNLLIN